MQTNLASSYVKAVESGLNLEHLVQELIDRVQYHEGAIDVLNLFLEAYEAPFETVDTGMGTVRRIKTSFQKPETNGTDNIEPNLRVGRDQLLQSMEVSGR